MTSLRLGGREFRCIDRMPPGVLLDAAEAIEAGETRAVLALKHVLEAIVVDEDQEALWALLRDRQAPPAFDELNEAVGGAIAEYTSRPTERPSRLPASSGASGPSTKPASSSPGTARVVNLSSKGGRSAVS